MSSRGFRVPKLCLRSAGCPPNEIQGRLPSRAAGEADFPVVGPQTRTGVAVIPCYTLELIEMSYGSTTAEQRPAHTIEKIWNKNQSPRLSEPTGHNAKRTNPPRPPKPLLYLRFFKYRRMLAQDSTRTRLPNSSASRRRLEERHGHQRPRQTRLITSHGAHVIIFLVPDMAAPTAVCSTLALPISLSAPRLLIFPPREKPV